jgi:hypothetical protein
VDYRVTIVDGIWRVAEDRKLFAANSDEAMRCQWSREYHCHRQANVEKTTRFFASLIAENPSMVFREDAIQFGKLAQREVNAQRQASDDA